MKLNKILASIITLWTFKRLQKDSDCLRNLIMKNVKRPIKANLNTKSVSSKSDQPKLFVPGKVGILIVTETILYSTFSTS